jgi:hypothetical protein
MSSTPFAIQSAWQAAPQAFWRHSSMKALRCLACSGLGKIIQKGGRGSRTRYALNLISFVISSLTTALSLTAFLASFFTFLSRSRDIRYVRLHLAIRRFLADVFLLVRYLNRIGVGGHQLAYKREQAPGPRGNSRSSSMYHCECAGGANVERLNNFEGSDGIKTTGVWSMCGNYITPFFEVSR